LDQEKEKIMKFKNVLITLCSVIAMLTLLIVTTHAQGPTPVAEDIVGRMKQELKLTDEQVKQITPIIQADVQKRKELMDQINNVRQDTENKTGQFLTPEQMTQWKNLQEQRKENKPFRHGGKFGGHGSGGGMPGQSW
jgi:Spy/CpxP family protein refolding chaperone